ncbi:hypothetical protein [Azospirillum soli]|uniref:hypothetical protein n=1 Tax=Azospirillum soli TaxID=1304799 RepID=UPI001AE9F866|nr:hypothetical protein [Azospirillum soli]MBP2311870.1 hypothetical protein [Azospirillum soli]
MNTTEGPQPQLPALLNPADIDTEISCEPRIRDLKLAEALGMADPHAIRRMIERHMDALLKFGEVISDSDRKIGRGRPSKGTYYLTKKQALYITAKSDTERAAMVTIQMVEVFDAVTSQGALPSSDSAPPLPITVAQTDTPALANDMLEGADQIAAFMGLSARQVYHLQRHLPVFTIGAKLFARKSTILQWIADQERAAIANPAEGADST